MDVPFCLGATPFAALRFTVPSLSSLLIMAAFPDEAAFTDVLGVELSLTISI